MAPSALTTTTINRAPTAPMTPPPTSAGGSSSFSHSDLVVLDNPKNLAAWEQQLANIATRLGASQCLVSSPEHPATAGILSLTTPASGESSCSNIQALGPSISSTVDNIAARYQHDFHESALRNLIAKTTSPSVYAWMLALGLSPSAGLPVCMQLGFARNAVLRVGECGTAKMRVEDVNLLKMLVDRMEGLEREAICAACVSIEYFHMIEAYVSKALRNRVTSGDAATEAWFLERSVNAEGATNRSRGAFIEAASSAAAARHEAACASIVSMSLQDQEGRVGRHGGGEGEHGYRDRSERETEVRNDRVGFSVMGSGTKRARSPGDVEMTKRVRH